MPVVYTTAAGDSFMAGLCVGLAQGQSLEEAAELAAAVSDIVVTRRGAQSSIPTREEVARALREKETKTHGKRSE